jgi:hypothetical protein
VRGAVQVGVQPLSAGVRHIIKMNKFYKIAIMIVVSVLYGYAQQNQINEEEKHFEVSIDVGLLWLGQISATVLPYKNIFIQGKVSSSLLIENLCFSAGYQFNDKIYKNAIFRIGAGYSRGKQTTLVFGEGENAPNDIYWNGITLQVGAMKYLSKNIGYNIMASILISKEKELPSINVGVVFGI